MAPAPSNGQKAIILTRIKGAFMKMKLAALAAAVVLMVPSVSYANQDRKELRDKKQWHDQAEKRKKLTDEQKQQFLDHKKKQQEENKQFRETQKQAFKTKREQVKSDASLTKEQKRAAVQAIRKEQREAAKQHFQTQREENKTFWSGIKPQ